MTSKEQSLVSKLSKLNNYHVRNMYWLLFSPSPLAERNFQSYPLFPEKWMEELASASTSFFARLDADPKELIAYLEAANTYRMGVYAEKLMAYFFDHFEGTKLLLMNHQLFDENRTIGEVDFVFEWKNRIVHVELCVKYYLAANKTSEFAAWVGPSGKDNLAKKLDKAKTHQLPISKSEAFVQSTNLHCSSYLFLKGMFYIRESYFPQWKNEGISFRRYMLFDEFLASDYQQKGYVFLKRPNWMAALYIMNGETGILPLELDTLKQLIQKYGALHLWSESDKTTFMVVKNGWPNLR